MSAKGSTAGFHDVRNLRRTQSSVAGLRPLDRLRTPSPVRTKVWGAETHPARTGPFRETGFVIGVLIPLPDGRHVRASTALKAITEVAGTPKHFF